MFNPIINVDLVNSIATANDENGLNHLSKLLTFYKEYQITESNNYNSNIIMGRKMSRKKDNVNLITLKRITHANLRR